MADDYINLLEAYEEHSLLFETLPDNDVVLICRNKGTGKIRKSRFSALYRNNKNFWKTVKWDFFIKNEDLEEIIKIMEEKLRKIKGNIDQIHLEEKETPVEDEDPDPFKHEPTQQETMGHQYKEVNSMTLDERRDKISSSINDFDEALNSPHFSANDMSSLMADAAVYSTLINKISIEEMADEEDKQAQRSLIQITEKSEKLMQSFIEALSRDYNLNQTAETILGKTEGVTSRHMVRVFILSIRFLDYIRHQFEYTGLYRRLKNRFSSYFPLYEPLNKRFKIRNFSPHSIMPRQPNFNNSKMEEIMLGMLFHDLGKRKNLLYFEGEEDYDRKIIEDHAFEGYFMIMKKTTYQNAIASVAGMHHEYYGHEKGYGVFRDNYSEFMSKSYNSNHAFDAILTNDYNDIKNFKAVAYLPAKVLEVVDVYDAMIDKDRLYKASMSSGEALSFMRQEMIVNNLELDPIVFDLFIKFLKQAKLI